MQWAVSLSLSHIHTFLNLDQMEKSVMGNCEANLGKGKTTMTMARTTSAGSVCLPWGNVRDNVNQETTVSESPGSTTARGSSSAYIKWVISFAKELRPLR